MKDLTTWRNNLSRTIEAPEDKIKSWTRTAGPPLRSADWTDSSGGELGLQSSAPSFIAEWQRRGPETLSGVTSRKLRFTFAPTQLASAAS